MMIVKGVGIRCWHGVNSCRSEKAAYLAHIYVITKVLCPGGRVGFEIRFLISGRGERQPTAKFSTPPYFPITKNLIIKWSIVLTPRICFDTHLRQQQIYSATYV